MGGHLAALQCSLGPPRLLLLLLVVGVLAASPRTKRCGVPSVLRLMLSASVMSAFPITGPHSLQQCQDACECTLFVPPATVCSLPRLHCLEISADLAS